MVERWDCVENDFVDDPKVDAYLEAIIEVGRQHGYSLGHEDEHGAFIVHRPNKHNEAWIRGAHISR